MSEPTTTDGVRDAYATMRQTFAGLDLMAGRDVRIPSPEALHAEFDLWLRKVQADAWNSGFLAGDDYGTGTYIQGYDSSVVEPTNPYLEASE